MIDNKPLVMSIVLLLSLIVTNEIIADDRSTRGTLVQLELYSENLEEMRQIDIRLPQGYSKTKSYPTVYVTDGEYNFGLVTENLNYMARWGLAPEMIVVGMPNTNRNRDYLPREDANHLYSGGADAYHSFLTTELIPYLDANYQTNDKRILIGHSFGGVFTLHSFFKQADAFSAYIALGSSAWVGNKVLFEEAAELFGSNNPSDAFVYMAVGENDGGPTVPFSKQLAEEFDNKAPDSLEWYFEVTPEVEHFGNFVIGLNRGFLKLFPQWKYEDKLRDAVLAGGASAATIWFEQQQSTLGYRFMPNWFNMGVLALTLVREEQNRPAAVEIIKQLGRHAPENPSVFFFAGMVNETAGNKQNALTAYKRALSLTKIHGSHPNEIQLPQIEAAIKRVE